MTISNKIQYKAPTRIEKISLYGKKIKYMKFQRAVTEPISKGLCFCSTRTIGEVIENKITSCELALNQNGYRLSGLATCKSAWCVRCCTMKINDRVNRIKQGIEGFFDEGKKVYFLTLTCKRSANFQTQMNFLRKGWKRLQNRFNYLKKSGHSFDYCKSFDITFKPFQEQSYHPHLHICLVTDNKLSKDKILKSIDSAWLSMPKIYGVYAGSEGQKLEQLYLWNYKKRATYLGKNSGLAFELGSIATKKGKGKGMSLSELIDRASDGCERSKEIYIKFLKIIKGQNTINFSRGWPKLLEVEREKDDYTIPITIPIIEIARDYKINLHSIAISILANCRARLEFRMVIDKPLNLNQWYQRFKVQ